MWKLTTRCHANNEALLIATKLASIPCCHGDLTIAVRVAGIFDSISLFHRSSEKTLQQTHPRLD